MDPLENKKVEITVACQVSLQTLADIIVTAVEGGIDYWSQIVVYKWTEGPEHTMADIIEIGDGDENKPHHIDCETIQRGITRILNGNVGIRSDLHEQVSRGVREDDAGHVDADGADCIVQAGLFSELVYG
jgi:hypothetical protein